MGNKIEHKGIVESIEGEHIRVKILQASACSECHAKSLCSSSESKEKLIDVYSPLSQKYNIGDEVKVCGSVTMGRNAVFVAFGLPLLLMIVWVVTGKFAISLNDDEIIVGVIVLLAIYYLIIRLFKNKMSKSFSFWIED